MIKVTDKAAKKLKELRDSESYSNDYNIRVKVKGGGCSGLLYDLNFDNILTEEDQSFEDNGTIIIVDKKSLFYERQSGPTRVGSKRLLMISNCLVWREMCIFRHNYNDWYRSVVASGKLSR